MLARGSAVDDRGETLVEVIVAIAILGLAAVAILAGLQLSVKTSDINRKQTTGGSAVRTWAEAIEASVSGSGYQASCSSTGYLPQPSGAIAVSLPSGYTPTIVSISSLAGDGSVASGCPDTGVQRVVLRLASNDARAAEQLTVVLRRPCGPGSSCA